MRLSAPKRSLILLFHSFIYNPSDDHCHKFYITNKLFIEAIKCVNIDSFHGSSLSRD